LPHPLEIEPVGDLEHSLARDQVEDFGDAVHARLPRRHRDQVPDTGLEHETERLDLASDDVVRFPPTLVHDMDRALGPDRICHRGQPRQLGWPLEPASRIEQESLAQPIRPFPQMRRESGQHLELGRGNDFAETEFTRRTRHSGQE
jgi:hypothetical protein